MAVAGPARARPSAEPTRSRPHARSGRSPTPDRPPSPWRGRLHSETVASTPRSLKTGAFVGPTSRSNKQPCSACGANTFLVPFPRAGLKARPKHPTSTWFWSKRSTRSLTCSPAPSTDRTGRFSTSTGHQSRHVRSSVEKRLQPFPIADLVRHVSIIKTTTHPLLTRRGPSYILYRAVRGRFMTSRLLRWKRSAPTDRQGR